MDATTHSPFRERRLWERILYMVFCTIAYSVAEFVIALIAIVQIVAVALSGDVNERILRPGRNVGAYARQIFDFVTFNNETVPFPFSDWPDEGLSEDRWQPAEKPSSTAAPSAPAPAPAPAPATGTYEAPAPEAATAAEAAPPSTASAASAPPAAEHPPASDDEPPKSV
ncbi:MAG: DUF4389 domain-containing protein [Pseudomonadota bacterium]|nr:DUF4389 domain-containing protein [Pseudomonadota bacterium]